MPNPHAIHRSHFFKPDLSKPPRLFGKTTQFATHHGSRAILGLSLSRDYPKGAMDVMCADIPASIFLTTIVWTLGFVYVKMLIPQTTTTNDNPAASRANCDRRAVRPRRVNESSDRMVLFHEKAASIIPCTKNVVNIGRSSS